MRVFLCNRGSSADIAALWAGLFASSLSLSCIVQEQCIFVYKKGYRWEGRVFAKGIDSDDKDAIVEGNVSECKGDAHNAALTAGDKSDPLYVALRNELLADAQLNCAEEAKLKKFKSFDCDPFSGANEVAVFPSGECTLYTEKELAKGDPAKCLPADPPATGTEGAASAPAPGDGGTGGHPTDPTTGKPP
jgi:hypothetical protein